jgi:hypothetical protein
MRSLIDDLRRRRLKMYIVLTEDISTIDVGLDGEQKRYNVDGLISQVLCLIYRMTKNVANIPMTCHRSIVIKAIRRFKKSDYFLPFKRKDIRRGDVLI